MLFAENGRRGIEALEGSPDVDLVLMDLMMPELDGYETTRTVRAMPEFRELPIIDAHGKGDEGRPREEHCRRGVGVHHQAGGRRTACSSRDEHLARR